MNFVKSYLIWIISAVAMLGLLVVQLVYVEGLRAEVREKNKPYSGTFTALKSKAKRSALAKHPTRGDLSKGGDVIEKIEAEGKKVQAIWRNSTTGLNYAMGGGRTKDGGIHDPAKLKKDEETGLPSGPVIAWDLFSSRMDELYNQLFDDTQKAMTAELTPVLEPMLKDYIYFMEGPDQFTDSAAAEEAKKRVVREAAKQSRIVPDREKINPVKLSEVFDSKKESDIRKGWKSWRHYLIARDILLRAVVKSSAEVERELLTRGYVDPKKREELIKRKQADEETKAEEDKIPWSKIKRKAIRMVERVDSITVTGPVLGNSVLPALKPVEGKEGEEKKAVTGEDAIYHDVFTVVIELKAHPKVIQSFMRQVLKGDDIFYVPVSCEIERFKDSEVTTIDTGTPSVVAEAEKDAAAPGELITRASSYREPAIGTKLTYQVYRFRFADTDNNTGGKAGGKSGKSSGGDADLEEMMRQLGRE